MTYFSRAERLQRNFSCFTVNLLLQFSYSPATVAVVVVVAFCVKNDYSPTVPTVPIIILYIRYLVTQEAPHQQDENYRVSQKKVPTFENSFINLHYYTDLNQSNCS